MSIIVPCPCGKSYPVKEDFAGRRVQCPDCGRLLTIPAAAGGPISWLPAAASPGPTASGPVVDLPLATRLGPAPSWVPPQPSPNGGPIVDLPVAENPAGDSPQTNGRMVLLLAVVFVLLLGGGGLAIFLILRENEPAAGSRTAEAQTRPAEPTTKAEDTRPRATQLPAELPRETKPPGETKPPANDVKPAPASTGWQGHTARILAVAFPRDAQFAFSASGGEVERDGMKTFATDTTLRQWEPASGALLKRFDGFKNGLGVVGLAPNGKTAVFADLANPNQLHLWDLANNREQMAFAGHDQAVLCAAITPDGRRVVSGGKDGRLRIWDADSGKQIGDGLPHGGFVFDVAISGGGRYAMTACADRTPRLFDLEERKLVKAFARHQDIVWCVAISPDGKFGASGGGRDYDGSSGRFLPASRDYEIRLWDLSTGEEVRRFRGHTDQVNSLAFSGDGRRLLSGSRDKTVRLWQVSTGRELGRFNEHTDEVSCVTFFPDGRRSLSGGFDSTLRVWSLPPDPGELAQRLLDPQAANRLQTLQEIAAYGPDSRDAVPIILKMLTEADPAIKRQALNALAKIGPVTKEHLELLRPLLRDAGSAEVRRYALDSLAALKADARGALPDLLPLLKDSAPAFRVQTVTILGAIGPQIRGQAFNAMLPLLRDSEATVARAAADALPKLGKPMKAEVPTLKDFLGDKGETVRRYGLVALTDLGEDAHDALPLILKVMDRDPSASLRLLALGGLLAIQADRKALVAPLTRALDDSDAKVAVKAAESLAALPADAGTLPALLKAMEHDDAAIQKIADDAMDKFPAKREHVKLLSAALRTKREAVLVRLLKILAKLGPDAAGAVPALIEVVKGTAGETRLLAATALGDIGPGAQAAGPVIVELLKVADRPARLKVCSILGKIQAAEAKEAIPFLVGLLKVDNLMDEEAKKDREAAHANLVEIGEPAVDELIKALTGDFSGGNPNQPAGLAKAEARFVTIQTLTAIGKKSKEPLRKALLPLSKVEAGDPVPQIREAAKEARKALQAGK